MSKPMLVFHTLHLCVDSFSESIAAEIDTARKEGQRWYGLELVKGIDVFRLGHGIYVQFVDFNEHSDLLQRIERNLRPALFSRQRMIEFGVWIGRTIYEVRTAKVGSAIRAEEIKFLRPKEATAA